MGALFRDSAPKAARWPGPSGHRLLAANAPSARQAMPISPGAMRTSQSASVSMMVRPREQTKWLVVTPRAPGCRGPTLSKRFVRKSWWSPPASNREKQAESGQVRAVQFTRLKHWVEEVLVPPRTSACGFLSLKTACMSTACRCRWTQRATSAGEPND